MARSLALFLIGGALCGIALNQGGLSCLLGWLGVNFLVLGGAHVWGRHGVFGKKRDGTLPIWSWVVFFPLHAFSLSVLAAARRISREPHVSPITNHLVVGSRPESAKACAGFDHIVDLTAEFQEVAAIREQPGYFCFQFWMRQRRVFEIWKMRRGVAALGEFLSTARKDTAEQACMPPHG